MKIAKYGLDNWVDLREYTPMDTVRQQLKLCSRQYDLYMKTVVERFLVDLLILSHLVLLHVPNRKKQHCLGNQIMRNIQQVHANRTEKEKFY